MIAATVATLTVMAAVAQPAHAQPGFALTSPVPTLEELSAQIHLLVATQAPDAVRAEAVSTAETPWLWTLFVPVAPGLPDKKVVNR
ncbi:hypothetical protein AU195_00940 [Mycobacterium sp. IS-1496]|nr:hypothetical protein AU195_00940 [Mycobacterium sp. IS-1496]